MSQRGAIVTEYIYCGACLAAACAVFEQDSTLTQNTSVTQIDGLPILAGKISGMAVGDELLHAEFELFKELAARICHPLRFAVIAEGKMVGVADESLGRVFTVYPGESQPREAP